MEILARPNSDTALPKLELNNFRITLRNLAGVALALPSARKAILDHGANLSFDHEPSGQDRLLIFKIAGATEGVMTLARFINSSTNHSKIRSLSAQVITTIAVSDFFIDEVGLTTNQQKEILNSYLVALQTGTVTPSSYRQVNLSIQACAKLHQLIKKEPGREILWEAFKSAADTCLKNTSEQSSLWKSEKLGGDMAQLLLGIVRCFEPDCPPRLEQAAWHWGASAQVIDDLSDYSKDQKSGNRTFMTESTQPSVDYLIGLEKANYHYQAGLACCETSWEMKVYHNLYSLILAKYPEMIINLGFK